MHEDRSPEDGAPEHGLLVVPRVGRRVLQAGLHIGVPLQAIPPFLLAVALHHILACNIRQALEVPAAPDLDGREIGRIRMAANIADALQLGELVQVDVLQIGKQPPIRRPFEDHTKITAPHDLEGRQTFQALRLGQMGSIYQPGAVVEVQQREPHKRGHPSVLRRRSSSKCGAC